MEPGFPSSEDFDERAHSLYNEGDLDGALDTLKEGLALYPSSVDLLVGLGYARLAREEFAWARRAFEEALLLDPDHEEGLVGLGEVLLRIGRTSQALDRFRRVEQLGFADDIELMLTVGRALFRAGLPEASRDTFARLATVHPDAPEVLASLAYALARCGEEGPAAREARRALRLDPEFHEARVFLGHLLFDRGDWDAALREFLRVPPPEHWDPASTWRVAELLRVVRGLHPEDPEVAVWERRTAELEGPDDPVERMLREIEAAVSPEPYPVGDPGQLELFEASVEDPVTFRVRLPDGRVFCGTAGGVVRQMRDHAGFSHESLAAFMRRMAEGWLEQSGSEVPFHDAEAFLRGAAAAGQLHLDP